MNIFFKRKENAQKIAEKIFGILIQRVVSKEWGVELPDYIYQFPLCKKGHQTIFYLVSSNWSYRCSICNWLQPNEGFVRIRRDDSPFLHTYLAPKRIQGVFLLKKENAEKLRERFGGLTRIEPSYSAPWLWTPLPLDEIKDEMHIFNIRDNETEILIRVEEEKVSYIFSVKHWRTEKEEIILPKQ